MKTFNILLVVLIGISFIGIELSYPQPKIPKKNIPTNITSDLRKKIEMLYSSDPAQRADGAEQIGQMGNRAILATPYLIEILKQDSTQLEKLIKEVDSSGKVFITGVKYTYTHRIAAEALNKITGKEFGEDSEKWQEWWEQNKEEFLKGR